MRIFIWDNVFEISFKEEEDIEYDKFSESQLAQIKELVNREKAAAESDYLEKSAQIIKGSPADFSDISERDQKGILAFIKLLETDKSICWPEFRHPELQEEPEETVAYEGEIWDFIDAFANSEICQFKNNKTPLKINEILAFLQFPELFEVAGYNTLRLLFASIVHHECPARTKTKPCGFIGELALKSLLVSFLSKLK